MSPRQPSSRSNGWEGDPARLRRMMTELGKLRAQLLEFENKFGRHIHQTHPAYAASARNLLHYVAMRQHDIRTLQEDLASCGLSSLGRAESHVMASLNILLRLLHELLADRAEPADPYQRAVTRHEGAALIETHTESLLGGRPPRRKVRIMVTMPSEAADDYEMVYNLVKGGMDCARINCAHDDKTIWGRMVKNIRKAQRELVRPVRILMDLGGPKLRTGVLEPGPRVVRWRPRRDVTGRVVAPARVWLTPAERSVVPPAPGTVVPVAGGALEVLEVGEILEMTDARGRRRNLRVVAREAGGWWAESDQTAYVVPGLELRRKGGESEDKGLVGRVTDVPPTERPIELFYGDTLSLTADPGPGRPALRDGSGTVVEPARISCTLPDIFNDLRAGERIWFDDGKIGGVIESATAHEVRIRIVRARATGDKLRADKGINLPDSHLRVKGLTEQDKEDLKFVVKNADLVALSFVRTPEDVHELQERLAKLGAKNLGIILKIETRQALEGLPAILLAAMRSHPIGVMIARGDLAVECGYERLAEAQEEILWLCEASHIPVIWATQVLENLTKQGLPSRAEITDAAMSVRAECVMLNKGPYILESLRVLEDILQRMEAHQQKKETLLGRLDVSEIDK